MNEYLIRKAQDQYQQHILQGDLNAFVLTVKGIREVHGLGLVEAKNLVEHAIKLLKSIKPPFDQEDFVLDAKTFQQIKSFAQTPGGEYRSIRTKALLGLLEAIERLEREKANLMVALLERDSQSGDLPF